MCYTMQINIWINISKNHIFALSQGDYFLRSIFLLIFSKSILYQHKYEFCVMKQLIFFNVNIFLCFTYCKFILESNIYKIHSFALSNEAFLFIAREQIWMKIHF